MRHVKISYLLLIVMAILLNKPILASESQANLYVSPNGEGLTCSVDEPCSLTTARDRVRQINDDMSSDILLYLRGGTYTLTETFALTAEDSGTNSFNIIYSAYPGETPVISGERGISGWTIYDSAQNIFRAPVGDLQTRQLYVNDQRAIRARGSDNPYGWDKTDVGYTVRNDAIAGWRNQSDLEIISFLEWKSFRCGVDSIDGRQVIMDEPCWSNALFHDEYPIGKPQWIENAYELLDEEREWYLDRSEGFLYYKPAAAEDMSSALVIAPVLETLVSGTDVQNIHFNGITFAYATWLRPSTNEGYAIVQAGWSFTGEENSWIGLARTPGNITFTNARSVRFEGNRFVHLGAVALNFEGASQNNVIERNLFEDISSTAIQIGQINDFNVWANARQVKDNLIRNNYITRIGQEYFDAVGIFLGYTNSTIVTHNEIYDVPYSGISVGWGWGTYSYARNNQITYNRIRKIVQVMKDGGGIYTLSPQPDSVISYNYIEDQQNTSGGLYLDEGSRYFTVTHNVVADVSRWLHIWTYSIQDNIVQSNCTDSTNLLDEGINNDISDNLVGLKNWPAECQAIIDNAGIEPAE